MAQGINADHRVVQTSAVFLLGCGNRPEVPPPSPPSPLSPRSEASEGCEPVDEFDLEPRSSLESSSNEPADVNFEEGRTSGAVHVLQTEATALQRVATLYETNKIAREGFSRAVGAITRHGGEQGKLVVIGVGKSGHIGKKIVATFNSLAVHATFLHPTEALHGDLGTIGKHDTILFITFSGKTQELLSVLPHINPELPQIILTSHTRPEDCEIMRQRSSIILLPAPIHEPEALSFGVCAPTTSTTVALAVGDALAVVASQELHSCVATVFAKNHPGGAIGAANSSLNRRPGGSHTDPAPARTQPSVVVDIATPMTDIAVLDDGDCGTEIEHSCAEVLRSGYGSKDGWVRVGDRIAAPKRIRKLGSLDLTKGAGEVDGLLVERKDMVALSAKTELRRAKDMVVGLMQGGEEEAVGGEVGCNEESVVAVVEDGKIVGVLEVETLLGAL
ncbi:putative sis domain-containing protein [Zalerion maritima]|uniref:Sis domain-containing protein n=1 Tax=Zalerion maritima TaxID=339359 RepID=A0AAD5RUW3_9PEZI|nr:putative sis domain-containing protein [Zalerion maritima]